MSKFLFFALLPAAFAIGVTLVGCTSQQPAAPSDSSQSGQAAAGHEGHVGHEDGDSNHAGVGDSQSDHAQSAGDSQYEEALADLSPADRVIADRQKICPVSGQPLGSMGTPYKVTVQDREVLLCCKGCEGDITEDPEKYLAKLPK